MVQLGARVGCGGGRGSSRLDRVPAPAPPYDVDGWVRRHTHHWDDWTLDALVAAKGGRVVSLVVPARNEAATVGDVVAKVRSALVETVALVDEIVVIDSDSTDDTYAVATDAGATVHRSAEIRPDLGTRPGKGEAMWKSLFVTSGELIVFMDADLVDWDTHFVPGLLGPLLTDPGVELVKGFYERPMVLGRRGRAVRGRPRHRAGRPAADPAALPRAGRAAPAAGGGVGGPPVALRAACRSRTSTPSSWPRSSTPSAPAGSTRSRRSTSAYAPTGTSRCATSAAWRPRSWRPRWPGPAPVPPSTERPPAVEPAMTLRLGRHSFADDATLMMAIVNRTPDSFYDQGATWAEDSAFERVALVVVAGRRDRRHRRHQGRARRRDLGGRGDGAGRRLRGAGAYGVPLAS